MEVRVATQPARIFIRRPTILQPRRHSLISRLDPWYLRKWLQPSTSIIPYRIRLIQLRIKSWRVELRT
jgi:hypothetical protein